MTIKNWTPSVRDSAFYAAFSVRLDTLMREFYPGLIPAAVGKWKHDDFCPQQLSLGGKSPCTCEPEIEMTIRLVKPNKQQGATQ